MAYEFGDVVLVSFPFTDQVGAKQRPAVVISGREYQSHRQDMVILAITSQVRNSLGYGEALLSNWQQAGLIKPSMFKPVLTTISQGLVRRIMGSLTETDAMVLRRVLLEIFPISVNI